MTFQESLDYLLSLGFELSVKKFGLENTATLLDALGNPQSNFLKIQIAGTNGKGSTCAFLESICLAADIKVGLNTSPHLVSITERVRINGEDISEKDFARLATHVRSVSEDLVERGKLQALPTYFEHVTAIAQLAFLENGVEVAILETGLGGRFDATTATNAEIVALTPIAMDHVKTLGPTIEDIASEKAAIIRHDTRVISVPQAAEVEKVILGKCIESGVEVAWATPSAKGSEASVITFDVGHRKYTARLDGMPGNHQFVNATLAIYIAEALEDWNLFISEHEIEQGLESTKKAGRLEFTDGFLFDGAHNAAGASALRDYLTEHVSNPITMIFGSMKGKALEEVSQKLFPLAKNLILTTPENPRAMPAEEIAEHTRDLVHPDHLFVVPDIREALKLGKEITGDGLLLITGSLYLIGEIKAHLREVEVQRRSK